MEEKITPGGPNAMQEGGDVMAGSRHHTNHPFRDLHKGGHDLNETYKVPVANPSGQNHSYMHPIDHHTSMFTGRENSPKILQPGMPAFVSGKGAGQPVGGESPKGASNVGSKTIGGGSSAVGGKPDKL